MSFFPKEIQYLILEYAARCKNCYLSFIMGGYCYQCTEKPHTTIMSRVTWQPVPEWYNGSLTYSYNYQKVDFYQRPIEYAVRGPFFMSGDGDFDNTNTSMTYLVLNIWQDLLENHNLILLLTKVRKRNSIEKVFASILYPDFAYTGVVLHTNRMQWRWMTKEEFDSVVNPYLNPNDQQVRNKIHKH